MAEWPLNTGWPQNDSRDVRAWYNACVKIYFSFSRNDFFRSTAQICKFSPWILPELWTHVTNKLDLRYFCQHNPFLFYHLNLIPYHYWSWQRNIYFLVNIFSDILFLCWKINIKTKFSQWPIWQNLLTFELLKDKRMF